MPQDDNQPSYSPDELDRLYRRLDDYGVKPVHHQATQTDQHETVQYTNPKPEVSMAITIVKWIVFAPVGLIGLALLNTLVYFTYKFAASYHVGTTLLAIIVAVIFASMAVGVLMAWCMCVIAFTSFTIALCPKPQIGLGIFLTLFSLCEVAFIVPRFHYMGWLHVVFEAFFTILVFTGAIMAASGKFNPDA